MPNNQLPMGDYTTWHKRVIPALVALTVLAIPRAAHAGCEKDTDCKGDRIRVEAECVDPPTYSRSAETLRKGLGYRRAAIVSGVVAAVLAVAGTPLVTAGLTVSVADLWLSGLVSTGSGFIVGMAVTLPSGVLAAGARTRAIERYNRAVEDERVGLRRLC